jgi:hypothetical protein
MCRFGFSLKGSKAGTFRDIARPVPGVVVAFVLPTRGPGVDFANGSKISSVVTGENGTAVSAALRSNRVQGAFQIHVSASLHGNSATAVITQTNSTRHAVASAATGCNADTARRTGSGGTGASSAGTGAGCAAAAGAAGGAAAAGMSRTTIAVIAGGATTRHAS